MEQDQDLIKMIGLSEALAVAAHFGQFRRDGVTPYVTHPFAVAAMVEPRLKPVAMLHDTLEDTWMTMHILREAGFPEYVVSTVGILTRANGCKYEIYIRAMLHSRDAVTVKLADMRHNLSCEPSQRSIDKAKWALPMLEEALNSFK